MIPIPSPGMEPPRPSGCPSCAAAEAQCDRMAQRLRELEAEVCDAAFAGHMIGADRAQDQIARLERENRALNATMDNLQSALDLEASARASVAESLAEVREAIHAALGNGADQWAWQPGERWLDAAVRVIRQARDWREATQEAPCTR